MISDDSATLSDLKDSVQDFIKERDWSKYHNPKDLAISISIEAAELLELFQWLKNGDISKELKKHNLMDRIKEELSDILIYSISLSNVLNLDLSEAIIQKIDSNRIKYPVEKIKGRYSKYPQISRENT